MPRSLRTQRGQGSEYWPGFVDALTTLLLVIIFLLVVFVLAQVVLSSAITGKDEALDRLNRDISELTQLLDLERQENADVRLSISQLSESLQNAVNERDELSASLRQLNSRSEALKIRAETAEEALADLNVKKDIDENALKLRLAEIVGLRQDITALKALRRELETEIADITEGVRQRDNELGSLRDRSKSLEARLADEEERTLLAQKNIEEQELELEELLKRTRVLESDYAESESLSDEKSQQINALKGQIASLRDELQRLNNVLDAAENKEQNSEATIADLGKRLNRALATKVEELSQYRSEFFGRLKQVLGNRDDVQIVGDRFVFQSEVLFDSGSADLDPGGESQMAALARTLIDISSRIPGDLDWLLRVDGHTDSIPISNARFRSNWELSASRAISVVEFLGEQGIPLRRLAATGFADNQPLVAEDSPDAYKLNRRIEIKLTQR